MTTEVRKLDKAHYPQWYDNLTLAFGGLHEAEEERALWDELVEFARAFAAWDGDELIGTASGFAFRMTVPGGASVPANGVTMVSVADTHRRQGVLTAMMRRQLDEVRALGEPLSVLTASEAPIYGRFGYEAATRMVRARIDAHRVRVAAPEGIERVRVRRAGLLESLPACEAVYAALVPGRPGLFARQPGWERLGVLDPEADRAGFSALRAVLAERDGEVVGYTRFQVKPVWDAAGTPHGEVRVRALEALDPAAYAALLRHVLSLDLVETVELSRTPLDAPWQTLVSDVRRCRPTLREELYVRIVDVGAALAARTYQVPVNVVVEVRDDFCPWNAGRWRLRGGPEGAECVRTEDAADLALSVRELGGAYLGGTSLAEFAAAGRVRELRAGALGPASLGFGSQVAPFLAHGF
ncbi:MULTISPECIES: GNAT family N-acetyltransferase [unclassified Streptomyces]|uniref:GNAT family N-acetyltransferase n=1 Tax=unclassified Streptomyces TaxID=2593676 RepID=UPI00081F3AA4|nr:MULTISPECIES: GNAT family N-acetyltransferase [unclassified Streptomyces]MYR28416.1 GNAT family N-acetyltransferase [Streptomyces sp. SID4945]SCF37477.1 Predicted acetyltransferase [Streptomyces sp. LcepLS]